MSGERGSVLIISLWVVAILSIAVLSLTAATGMQLKVLDRRLEAVESKVAFLAGSKHAGELYAAEKTSGLGPITPPDDFKKDLEIVSLDEISKLNINLCSKEALFFLLTQLGQEKSASFDPSLLGQMILDFRLKKNIEYLEELRGMADLSDSDIEALNEYFTVYGNGKVNINTANDRTIRAVMETSRAGSAGARRAILEAVLTQRREAKYFKSGDMDVEPFLSKLHLSSSPEMNTEAAQTLQRFTTLSHLLRLQMKYRKKYAGTVLMDLASDHEGQKNKVVFWHEKILAAA